MPSVDIRASKWDRWFEEDPAPEWPEFLTQKYWDKKKSLTAKATATGIGAQLTATKKAFDKAVGKRAVLLPRNLDEVEGAEARGLAFIRDGATKALHDSLKELRDTAKKAQETYKKSKAPGLKDTIKLCADIETAADHLMVTCNPNSLKGHLKARLDAATDLIHERARKLVGPTIDKCRTVPGKVVGELKTLEEELDALIANGEPDEEALKVFRSKAQSKLFDMARDMTQPIVNLHKALQAGVTLDGCTMRDTTQLKELLVPYGDGDAASCAKATPEQIRAKIVDVRRGAQLFAPIARDVKIAG